jgi:hypothetical protein
MNHTNWNNKPKEVKPKIKNFKNFERPDFLNFYDQNFVKKGKIKSTTSIKKQTSPKLAKESYSKQWIGLSTGNSRNHGYKVNKKRKKTLLRYLKCNLIGRPFHRFKFLLAKNYLHFNLNIRPNNIFANIKDVRVNRHPLTGKYSTVSKFLRNKKPIDFKIVYSRKGMKNITLTFLRKFFSTLRYLKTKPYSFIALDISTPKNIRKKTVNFISTFFLTKKFKSKKILFNIKHHKVFNGCRARKQVRVKRSFNRLYK